MSTTRSPSTRCRTSKRSHSSPALAWRNQTRSPIARSPPRTGVWTSPAPSWRSSFRPGGKHGAGEAVAARGARGGVAAAEHGGHATAGAAHDRQREEGGRARREARVGVEQRRREEAGSRSDLGDCRLGRGALHRPRAAAVDEPQRRQRGHHRRAPRRQLARRRTLDRSQRHAQRGVRRPVADAGDLRLVHHQPVELEPAGGDLARQLRRLRGGAQRRPLGSDPYPAAERPPAGVDVQAHAAAVEQLEVLAASTISVMPSRGSRSAARFTVGYATTVSVAPQPQRLGQRERQQPAEPGRPALGRSARGSGPTWWPAGRPCRRPARSRSAALESNASRSTAANGGSRSAVARFRWSCKSRTVSAVRFAKVPRFVGDINAEFPHGLGRRGTGEPQAGSPARGESPHQRRSATFFPREPDS